MKASRNYVAVLLTLAVIFQLSPLTKACGPESLQPIFVMRDSPDPPFREFTQGKIGILKPSFGRKTLVIAYRYLNGGSFNEEEQKALIEALKGTGPEPDTEEKIKEWIAARKLVVKDEDELPDIYRESRFGSYDFFPNCTSNAFEVAIETLKDRSARFGADNNDVHEWLSGQDTVFRNCSDTSSIPTTLGAERPEWLRKDRDYQIAASFFYSLQFDEAVKRFEQISHDNQSSWQSLADYLVGRTLVRQASLERDEPSKLRANQKAEAYVVGLSGRASKYRDATRKLLALIKYRLHPEDRVRELAQMLQQSASIDVRQDLIDYVWLLDKFDLQAQKQEEERHKWLNPPKEDPENTNSSSAANYEPRPPRDQIDIRIYNLNAAGQIDYATGQTFSFKQETSKAEILKTIETSQGRKLTDEETRQVNEQHEMALYWRRLERSPNRKLGTNEYEGCDYDCKSLPLSLYPTFLRIDELSDWVFTFQSKDPQAYSHALRRWRDLQSPSWFVAALVKANKTSPSLSRLLSHAEQIQPDMPMYATVTYNRIRLLIELGRVSEARQLLNQISEDRLDSFPVSAQNEFLEQRMNVAESLSAFLRFALRKPISFFQYGKLGSIKEILGEEESYEEVDEQERERVKRLIEWDGRGVFDERVAEILNWHFSVSTLMDVARDPAVPPYIRERVLSAAWTRAILLKNDVIARQATVEILRTTRDNPVLFQSYLDAHTAAERDAAAIFALLKSPYLTPYLSEGVPDIYTGDDGYYLEMAWWCVLPQTDYDEESKEIPKQVFSPRFFTPELLNAAEKERAEIIALGDAKSFLGKKAIEWAKLNPHDTRVPEALFIAAKANESYKYGCNSWSNDDDVRKEAASLLIERYPNSVWALRMREMDREIGGNQGHRSEAPNESRQRIHERCKERLSTLASYLSRTLRQCYWKSISRLSINHPPTASGGFRTFVQRRHPHLQSKLMKAVVFRKHGGPEVLEYTEVPEPSVRPDHVLVRVKACALNHLDVFVRNGLPGIDIPFPHILGNDVAGIVREVGELVTWVKPGDEVMLQPGLSCGHCAECLRGEDNLCRQYDMIGYRHDGGYAEFVAAPGVNVIPKPAPMSWEEAAAMPLVTLTAWHMLVTRAKLQAGETLLVHAAGSGVGSIAIQIGKLLGARVIATAGADDKLTKARDLGADETINYTEGDWPKEIRKLTNRVGVDVVFEHTGAATWEGSITSLKNNGRLVTCGATSGYDARTDIRQVFYRHLTILGSFMGSKAELLAALKFVEQGKIRAVVDRVLPLSEARRAHELMEDRAQFGKLVLMP